MKTSLQFKNTLRVLLFAVAFFGIQNLVFAQTNPVAQALPYSQNFGTATFSANPAGIANWNGLSGATVSTQALAEASVPSGNATITGIATATTTGGTFGFASSSNGRMYVQTSSNTTNGVNQIAMAINTTNRMNITVGYDVEIISAQPRTVGIVMQYRVGISGTWTTVTGTGNPYSQAAGTTGVKVSPSIVLPSNANNQPVVQVRWAIWRGTESGNSSGIAIDNITVTSIATNTAPTASNVQISGTPEVGQTLTGSFTYADTENDPQGTSTYRWFRADNNAGLNEAVIGGQTATTYTLTATDASRFIRFGVTPVATTGTSPGTEAYSSYVGPVTTSANALSTITANPGFISPSNIDYTAFLGTNVTGSSIQVAQFIVTDVPGSTNDGLSTTLTNLTFSLSSFEQYEKVALYDDNNTEIQELASAATLSFSGLSIQALSGSTKTFSVRVTFKSVVTDNVQPQLIVTAATANSNGSFFASPDAGGASSSVANNDNKIEVVATVLEFVQNVTNTNAGINMTPAVTVKAVDTNQNTDLDFTATVSITSTGTLAAPQNVNAIAGVATFASINHTVPQVGVQLTATTTGLTSVQSALFNITVQEAGVLLFEENFDYVAGQNLTANGWVAHSAAGNAPVKVHTSGLSFNGYGSTNIGNAVIINANGEDVNKTFTPTQASGTTTYAAFLINVSSATAGGEYVAHLGPNPIGTEFRSRFYIRNSTGNLRFGISTSAPSGLIEYSTTDFAFNTTYLVVMKYFFNGTNMIASLYINPSLYSEPATATATLTTAAVAETNVGAFGIRQSSTNNIAIIDGIRIATNWGTALGNPQYISNATINAGNYNSINIIDGTVTANGSITVNNAIAVNTGNLEIPNNTNLIQKGTSNNNSGSITVNRNALMKRLDYVYWSSPVAGQNILDFSPETITNRFYELNEVSNTFVGLSTPEFVAAKGYSIRAPNTFDPNPNAAPQTFNGVFNGVPNNGDISIPMTNSGAGKGFNLLGNPYPSTINADAFLDANTSIGTIYFWTHSQQGASSAANYASYNSTGQAAASTTTPVSATPNGTIQVGQGFLANSSTSTNAVFTNDMRVNNTAGQFFRALANEKNRIWLNLSNATETMNQALIGYVSNATNAVDNQFDGKLIETDGSKLYSFLNDSEYVIQGRALPFADSDSVALGFKAATDGNYTITLDHVDGLFSGDQNIFIKDNLTGTTHNIKESAYTFASNAGTFNNRFAVVYQAAPLGIENPTLNADSIVVFNQNGVLNINAGATVMQTVKIFDIRGRLLFDNKNVNATTTTIQNLGDAKQVLVIQITSDKKTVSKKVVF